jgi:single-stranded-DNA-specific exonuclease
MADGELEVEEVTIDLIRQLGRLGPHGIGNPAPVFHLREMALQSIQVLKDRHLKMRLPGGIEALWWNAVEHRERIEAAPRVRIMGRLDINTWRNRESCQIQVLDVATTD